MKVPFSLRTQFVLVTVGLAAAPWFSQQQVAVAENPSAQEGRREARSGEARRQEGRSQAEAQAQAQAQAETRGAQACGACGCAGPRARTGPKLGCSQPRGLKSRTVVGTLRRFVEPVVFGRRRRQLAKRVPITRVTFATLKGRSARRCGLSCRGAQTSSQGCDPELLRSGDCADV